MQGNQSFKEPRHFAFKLFFVAKLSVPSYPPAPSRVAFWWIGVLKAACGESKPYFSLPSFSFDRCHHWHGDTVTVQSHQPHLIISYNHFPHTNPPTTSPSISTLKAVLKFKVSCQAGSWDLLRNEETFIKLKFKVTCQAGSWDLWTMKRLAYQGDLPSWQSEIYGQWRDLHIKVTYQAGSLRSMDNE